MLGWWSVQTKEGGVWTKVVAVQKERWEPLLRGVREGHAVCVCGGLRILPTPWGSLSGQSPI